MSNAISIRTRDSSNFNRIVELPALDRISNPKVAEAAGRYVDAHAAAKEARRARDKAKAAHIEAENREEAELAEAIYENPGATVKNAGKASSAAKAEIGRTILVAKASGTAFDRAYGVLMGAIDHEKLAWIERLHHDADKAVLSLATALHMAETAQLDLDESLGLLEMYRANDARVEEGGYAKAAMVPSAHVVHLSSALGKLRTAVGTANARVREI